MRWDLSNREGYKVGLAHYSSLLSFADAAFLPIAERDGWELTRDAFRQPSRGIKKTTADGLYTGMMGIFLEQAWYHLDSDEDARYSFAYTFYNNPMRKVWPPDYIIRRVLLAQHAPLDYHIERFSYFVNLALDEWYALLDPQKSYQPPG